MPSSLSALLHDLGLVVFSVGLSWVIGTCVSWQREKRNMRLLVAAEVLENYGRLQALYVGVQGVLNWAAGTGYDRANGEPLPLYLVEGVAWSRSRWEMSGVGAALKPREIMEVIEWYGELDIIEGERASFVDRMTFLYERDQAGASIDWEAVATSFGIYVDVMRVLVEKIPPYLDDRLDLLPVLGPSVMRNRWLAKVPVHTRRASALLRRCVVAGYCTPPSKRR